MSSKVAGEPNALFDSAFNFSTTILWKGAITMKKKNVILSYLGLFMLVASITACASEPRQQTTEETIRKTTTTTETPTTQEKRTTTTTTESQ